MKAKTFLFIIIILLQQYTAKAQTSSDDDHFAMRSKPNNARYHHWCAAHQAGVITLCAGGAGMLAGIALSDAEGHSGFEFINTGDVITLLSAAAVIVGVNLSICGIIHDHYHPKKFTLIVPKKNEFGLAYHF